MRIEYKRLEHVINRRARERERNREKNVNHSWRHNKHWKSGPRCYCFDIGWEKRNRCQNHWLFFPHFIFHFTNGETYATHIEISSASNTLNLGVVVVFFGVWLSFLSNSKLSYFMKYRFRFCVILKLKRTLLSLENGIYFHSSEDET